MTPKSKQRTRGFLKAAAAREKSAEPDYPQKVELKKIQTGVMYMDGKEVGTVDLTTKPWLHGIANDPDVALAFGNHGEVKRDVPPAPTFQSHLNEQLKAVMTYANPHLPATPTKVDREALGEAYKNFLQRAITGMESVKPALRTMGASARLAGTGLQRILWESDPSSHEHPTVVADLRESNARKYEADIRALRIAQDQVRADRDKARRERLQKLFTEFVQPQVAAIEQREGIVTHSDEKRAKELYGSKALAAAYENLSAGGGASGPYRPIRKLPAYSYPESDLLRSRTKPGKPYNDGGLIRKPYSSPIPDSSSLAGFTAIAAATSYTPTASSSCDTSSASVSVDCGGSF